jgi:exopolysaccharide biosynthesis polyprenyl glycosylphosphotransferase
MPLCHDRADARRTQPVGACQPQPGALTRGRRLNSVAVRRTGRLTRGVWHGNHGWSPSACAQRRYRDLREGLPLLKQSAREERARRRSPTPLSGRASVNGAATVHDRGPRFSEVPAAVGELSEAPSRRSVEARESSYRRLLAAADAIAAFGALFTAVAVLGDDRLRATSLLLMPVAVVASKLVGLYERDELVLKKTTLEESAALFQMSTLFALVTWLLDGIVVDGFLGNRQVLGLWGLLFIMGLLGRSIAREIARRRSPVERCMLAGPPEAVEAVLRGLANTRRVKAEVVGHLPLEGAGRRHEDTVRDLEEAIIRKDVDRVIIAPRETDSDEFLDLISLVKSLGVRVSVLPRIFEVVGTAVEFDTLNGITVLGVRRFGLTRSSRALKRAMDIVGASIGLVAISPLLAAMVIAIRLDSRGPILFRQTRVGRNGERFTMLKFRTMVDGADALKPRLAERNEATGLFKITDDPRITRVGRWLRRTSLDELPQLINVLRGEMSLVGPRPLVVDEDSKIQGRHRRRLQLTPGMTGDWQILGSSRIPLHEMVKIDYLYVTNWSVWNDVKILARTVVYVFSARGM